MPSNRTSRQSRESRVSSTSSNRWQEEEENWTEIADPDTKKRIQNRLAQRAYRERLKHRLARLESLQKHVDNLERLNITSAQRPGVPSTGDCIKVALSATVDLYANIRTPPSSYGDRAEDTLLKHLQKPNTASLHIRPHPEPSSFHSLQQQHSASDAIIPWLHFVDSNSWPNASLDISGYHQQEATLNLNANWFQPPTMMNAGASDRQEQPDTLDLTNGSQTNASDLHESYHYALSDYDNHGSPSFKEYKIDIEGPAAYKETDKQISPKSQIPCDSSTNGNEANNLQKLGNLIIIIETIYATQFKNFDEVVSYYYTGDLSRSSRLRSEQINSRNTRLPGILNDLFRVVGNTAN